MLTFALFVASAPLVTGDIVLEASSSPQSFAIAAATHSAITHAGVVVVEDGATWVYEAVGPCSARPSTPHACARRRWRSANRSCSHRRS